MPTDTDNKTSSNGGEKIPLPTIALPKGGGAIRNIGEKFQVNDLFLANY
jgi:hypothetical protein